MGFGKGQKRLVKIIHKVYWVRIGTWLVALGFKWDTVSWVTFVRPSTQTPTSTTLCTFSFWKQAVPHHMFNSLALHCRYTFCVSPWCQQVHLPRLDAPLRAVTKRQFLMSSVWERDRHYRPCPLSHNNPCVTLPPKAYQWVSHSELYRFEFVKMRPLISMLYRLRIKKAMLLPAWHPRQHLPADSDLTFPEGVS